MISEKYRELKQFYIIILGLNEDEILETPVQDHVCGNTNENIDNMMEKEPPPPKKSRITNACFTSVEVIGGVLFCNHP